MKRALILGSALMLAACSTPPIDTPHTQQSVTLSEMTGGKYNSSVSLPLMPAIPPFQVQAPSGMPINVPSQAQSVNLSSATLHIKLTNHMQIPLTLQLALSKTDTPYSDPAANIGTAVTIDPNASKQIDQSVDPSLFKVPTLHLGVTFSSPGSSTPVTVAGTDHVDVDSWATVQVKLF